MTKAEKRVAIAKDVLKQIRRKTILPQTGHYVNTHEVTDGRALIEGADLKMLLDTEKIKSCTTCALGAALLSYVRIFDKFKIWSHHIGSNGYGEAFLSIGRGEAQLVPIFGARQLDAIECAFEGTRSSMKSGREYDACVAFSQRYNDEQRLAAIMRNIVKNDGKFIPPPVKITRG